jgi:alcohol dehydrogenase class IV
MRLVKEYLPRVHAAPDDIEARAHMMSAGAMGAVAFQKGLGAIHALSHPIGAMHDTHHGMTNAVVMPAVLQANRAAIEDRIERLASFLGVAGGFDGFMDFVLGLRAGLGVPPGLIAFGVPETSFDAIAEMAPDDPTAGGNPIKLTRDLAREMVEAAR